ncbi:hypothetical protein ACLOJK_023243 [Asimina triloba]
MLPWLVVDVGCCDRATRGWCTGKEGIVGGITTSSRAAMEVVGIGGRRGRKRAVIKDGRWQQGQVIGDDRCAMDILDRLIQEPAGDDDEADGFVGIDGRMG